MSLFLDIIAFDIMVSRISMIRPTELEDLYSELTLILIGSPRLYCGLGYTKFVPNRDPVMSDCCLIGFIVCTDADKASRLSTRCKAEAPTSYDQAES